MKSSTRDKAEGTFHEAKGKVKEMAGKITDNPKLEAKGKAEKIAGKVRKRSVRSRRSWGSNESGVSCTKGASMVKQGRGEGCEVAVTEDPKLTQMFNKVKGGNYHEY